MSYQESSTRPRTETSSIPRKKSSSFLYNNCIINKSAAEFKYLIFGVAKRKLSRKLSKKKAKTLSKGRKNSTEWEREPQHVSRYIIMMSSSWVSLCLFAKRIINVLLARTIFTWRQIIEQNTQKKQFFLPQIRLRFYKEASEDTSEKEDERKRDLLIYDMMHESNFWL